MNNLKNTLNSDLNIDKTSNNLIKKLMNINLNDFKIELMNSLQYSILSIIPIVLILKVIKNVIPSVDETKGSIELLFESIGQLSLTIFFILLTHTLVRLIPTYSGENYTNLDSISFIIPFLFLMLTMQTKIGEKFNILALRFLDYWNGNYNVTDNMNNMNNMNNSRNLPPNNTSNLLPSNTQNVTSMPTHINKQVNNNTLPPTIHTQRNNMNYEKPKDNFNDMYQKNTTNNSNEFVNMNSKNSLIDNEPIAANLGVNSVYSNW
jgi:hypothetical protein